MAQLEAGSDLLGSGLDWSSFKTAIPKAPADLELYLVPFDSVSPSDLPSPAAWERDRYASIANPDRRRALLLGRGVLRAIVAQRFSTPLDHLKLTKRWPYVAYTKADGSRNNLCSFSLSRNEHAAAVLLSSSCRPIGVDIEMLQSPDQAELLIQVLHPKDQARLRKFGRIRREALTQAWTHKESLLKAQGIGLGEDPAAAEIGSVRHPKSPTGWTLSSINASKLAGPIPQYVSVAYSKY